mgnify:FL=1
MAKKYTFSILLALLLTSCGGGGGGGGGGADTAPPLPMITINSTSLSVLIGSTVTISWSVTNASSCTATGAWSGTKSLSGTEDAIINTPGNNTFTLTCQGSGGGNSKSVVVEGYRNTDGVVVDGYISSAEVFVDEDEDWMADSNESSTTSDNNGKFTIKYADGYLVSLGGTDLDSQTLLDNLLITHKLTGHTDFKAVTPVTSVAAFMATPANINTALGIDASIDVYTFDPVANKGDGGINDYLYEKGNQLTVLAYALQNINNDLKTSTETTQDYFKAISEEVEKEYTETSAKVDIETEAFITKVLDNVVAAKTLTFTDEVKTNTLKALSGVIPVVEVKSTNELTTAVISFATSKFQTDIKAIANGTATAETINSYKTDILNYIATSESVTASLLAPSITAIDDNVSTDEDTQVTINVLANDSYLSSAPITVTAANPSNGAIVNNANVITYTPSADYNGADSFSYTITQGDKTASAVVSITVNAINDAPSIDVASTLQAAENQTAVATISVSDPDADDTLTLSMSGTDADSFDLSSSNVLTFKTPPDAETKNSYSITFSLTDGTLTVTKDVQVQVVDIDEEMNTSNPCSQFIQYARANEFRYCWEEDQTTPDGTDYSANVISPLIVTFGNQSINIPDSNYAEELYQEYGVILSSDGDKAWDKEKAYAIVQTMKKIPQPDRGQTYDYRVFSKWTLTDLELTDDIQITTNSDGTKSVNISSSVFTNANPRIATVEGKRGIYYSNRLHHALVRYVTNNGADTYRVNKILTDRYGVSLSPTDYPSLTASTTNEDASRFQSFQPSELVSIINMFEEMPSGFHKIQGLNYLIRRVNGADHPLYPDAPAVAWPDSGYIEFMESAFKTFDIEHMHRLILHEKAHFLYRKVFDTQLLTDWVNLGGWTHSSGDNASNFYNGDGWTTSKQTEFVSAYAHGNNPNEDMAESISYFIVNPDALRSRAEQKYIFVRDRIMQGNIYISQIREDLTFTVYNLYPDYVFPGKINRVQISVEGEPNEDKTVKVEIRLHALDKVLEGANYAYTRIQSPQNTFQDFYLYPTDGSGLSTKLQGSVTLSKYAAQGYWQSASLSTTDNAGNQRFSSGGDDYGWRMFVNNPMEDLTAPEYIANSISLSKTTREVENQTVDVIVGKWQIDEPNPKENQGCFGALNDENETTYSIQKYSPQNYSGDYQPNNCYVEYLMPYYMPSGTWRLNYIFQKDVAGNKSRNYFKRPAGTDGGQWPGGEGVNGQLDEMAPEVTLSTSNPDTTAPELDLNVISVTAEPTNPNNPNGETKVDFTFRVKDDISGYRLGYYKFRDPQGSTYGNYHYPPARSQLFPTDYDTDWYEYTDTVILPQGSAPGLWGITELTLQDRARNFKTYDFTEIVKFDVTE